MRKTRENVIKGKLWLAIAGQSSITITEGDTNDKLCGWGTQHKERQIPNAKGKEVPFLGWGPTEGRTANPCAGPEEGWYCWMQTLGSCM